MFKQLGNKSIVLKKIMDVIEYIDQEQNSADMYPYKQMLIKMCSTMMNGLAVDADQKASKNTEIPSQKIPKEYSLPKKSEPVLSGDCGDCGCGESKECSIPMMKEPQEVKPRIIPEFNIQDTIEKIKGELNASKN